MSIRRRITLRAVLCGDKEVGKTSMVLQSTDTPLPDVYVPTIGMDVSTYECIIHDHYVSLKLFDLSGDMRFDYVIRPFLMNAPVILFCFDLTRQSTFDSLPRYVKRAKELTTDGFEACLVGIKSDLETNVQQDDIMEFAATLDATYFSVNSFELSSVIYLMHTVAKIAMHAGPEEVTTQQPGYCPCM